MKLKRFKEKDNKKIGIIVFTIVCILLVSGVILYRTFAIFEVNINQNIINGKIQNPGDLYFAFYVDDVIQTEMPKKDSGYILDEEKSYCGVLGEKDKTIQISLSEDWDLIIHGLQNSKTKCNLYFRVGYIELLGQTIPVVTSGDGLYEVKHNDLTSDSEEEGGILTSDLEGWKQTEYRFAGVNPNNYVTFNDEAWRVIGLVNVKTTNGEIEQRVKITPNGYTSTSYAWSTNQSNDWTQATLMTYLNTEYYNNIKNDTYKNMIDKDITWNIGAYTTSDLVAKKMYENERGTLKAGKVGQIEWNKKNTIEGTTFNSIGILYPSDVGYGVGENRQECLETTLYNYNNEICHNNNWIDYKTNVWLLSASSSRTDQALYKATAGRITVDGITDKLWVKPVLYLAKTVQISGGTGEPTNRFTLKN